MGPEDLRKGQPALFSPVVAAVSDIPPLVRAETVRVQINHRYLTAGQDRRKLGCFFQEGREDGLRLGGCGLGKNGPGLRSYVLDKNGPGCRVRRRMSNGQCGAGKLFLQLFKAGAAQLIERLNRKE